MKNTLCKLYEITKKALCKLYEITKKLFLKLLTRYREAGHASRLYMEWVLYVVVAILFCGIALYDQWFWRINYTLYDAAIQKHHRASPDDIVIFEINDDDISSIGRWPWPRGVHAHAINRLTDAGARAVLFDILFSEPEQGVPKADKMLADAIRRNGRVVLPLVHEKTSGGLREQLPIPLLADAAAALGHVHSEFDLDGIIRSTYLFEGLGQARWPHASLALFTLIDPQNAARYSADQESKPSAKKAETWQRRHWFHIPFFKASDAKDDPARHYFKSYSYVQWAAGEIPLDVVRDRIVFVGATATGLGDTYPTPLSGFSRPMSGVEINAHTFEALRLGIDVRKQSFLVSWGLFSLLLLILFAAYFRLRPGAAVIATVVMLVVGYYSTEFFLYLFNQIVQPAAFLLMVVLAYPLWSWRRLATALHFLEQENRLLRQQSEEQPMNSPSTHHPLIEPVSRSIEALRKTRERLEVARRERKSFLNFLSHDMRSPQSSIIALIEMRRQSKSHLTDDECFRKIEHYARKTSRLADEFVMYAKASQLVPRALKELELTGVIDETLDEIWPLAEKRNITFRRNYDQEVFVNGHTALLSRALFNLVHNAVKFSPKGSEVTVSVADEGDFWRVAVKDQGEGLSEEAQQRLLGLPESLSSPTETSLILGLTLVHTVINRHGGSLKIDSAPEQGATFSFTLPKLTSSPA